MKRRRHYKGCRDPLRRSAQVCPDWILDELHIDSPSLQSYFRRFADGHGMWIDGDPPRPVGVFRRRADEAPIMFTTEGGRVYPQLDAPEEEL